MRGDFYITNDPNPPTDPWGDDPPPEPEGTTEEERSRVVDAWSGWAHYRPYYRRTDDHVEVQINLHDVIWSGEARDVPGRPKSDTYWVALQRCIVSWRTDIDEQTERLKAEGQYPYDGRAQSSGQGDAEPPQETIPRRRRWFFGRR